MRIVAGRLKGKKLTVPEGRETRPTADRTREAVFNVLTHRFVNDSVSLHGAVVLDVFAGTGAMGLEAYSRGAAKAVFLENNPAALKVLKANVAACRLGRDALIVEGDATRPKTAILAADLAFLDPPYAEGLLAPALAALAARGWLVPGALAVAEGPARGDVALPPGFALLDDRRYGKARVLFLRWEG